jgi:hypothetical protein
MSYEYIGEDDLYFVSGGSAKLVKRGQQIREDDEDYFLKRYPHKIREIPGTTSRMVRDIDTLSPSTQELMGLKEVVVGQAKVIEKQSDQIDKLIKAITKSASQPVVFQPTIQVPQASTETTDSLPEPEVLIAKPELKNTFIPSVVSSEGITAKGEAGDAKIEGEKIDDKISKLKRFKKKP